MVHAGLLPRKDLKVEDWLSRDWKEHYLPFPVTPIAQFAHMDTHAYGSNSPWQASPSFHVPDGFEGSLSTVSWGRSMEDVWSYETELRGMEEPPHLNQRESFDGAKSAKQDDFSLSISCGNDLYGEAKSFKPDTFPQTPHGSDPPVCAPADLSPPRRASTPVLSPSTQSLASVPSMDLRPITPDYFHTENFSYVGPEPTRAEIKKNPHAFVNSVFPHSDQGELRDRLREVLRSQWWLDGTSEPRGFLGNFVRRITTKVFECQSCGKTLPRADRAIDHFRVHILHRPFRCEGLRGCGDYNCQMAFMTRDCLKSHGAKHEKICARCHTTVEDKNLMRHQATRKCRRFGL